MTKLHPWRPKQGHVLICENKADHYFIENIMLKYAPKISVSFGQGVETLPKLAEIMRPAFYIRDRDFRFSEKEAIDSLKSDHKKARFVWSHIDIESYLLHPDWLWQFIQDASSAKRPIKIKNPPIGISQIEDDIKNIAMRLVPDHAGRRTVELIDKRLNLRQRGSFGVPETIKKDKLISVRDEWKSGLSQVCKVIQQNITNAEPNLEISKVLERYEEQIKEYNTYLHSLETIRIHFSGERILKLLVHLWDVPGVKNNKDWKVIRGELVEYAIDYSTNLTGYLSDDDRLYDFGHIATKITGRKI